MPDRRRVELGDTLTTATQVLPEILVALQGAGFTLVGPQVRENTIVYDRLQDAEDLPRGFTTEQAPGRFRLLRDPDAQAFDFIPGSASWKQFLFPPRHDLFELRKDGNTWVESGAAPEGVG